MAIGGSILRPGDQLPTVRQLAVDLSVNPNTVVRAYRELEFEGLIVTQQGSGTFVSDTPCPVDAVVLREHYELADYDRKTYIATKGDLLVYPEPNVFSVNFLGNTKIVNK